MQYQWWLGGQVRVCEEAAEPRRSLQLYAWLSRVKSCQECTGDSGVQLGIDEYRYKAPEFWYIRGGSRDKSRGMRFQLLRNTT